MEKENNMRLIADKLMIKTIDENIILDKRLIIIGDIHGCYDDFLNLLSKVDYDNNNDILISVGDLIMKGPNSIDVLNFFLNNKNTLCVMGNHEYAVVRWYDAINNKICDLPFGLKVGSEHEQFSKLLNFDQINYLKSLPHIIKIPKYNLIVAHAGINPNFEIDQNNSFDVMHVRNILDNGLATELIKSGSKWIDLWDKKQTIIFGHDATRGIQNKYNAVGLDSACVYGKFLTCIIFPEKKIISVPAMKQYIKPDEKVLLGEKN